MGRSRKGKDWEGWIEGEGSGGGTGVEGEQIKGSKEADRKAQGVKKEEGGTGSASVHLGCCNKIPWTVVA